MTAVGAVLAVFVVLVVEGYEVRLESATAPDGWTQTSAADLGAWSPNHDAAAYGEGSLLIPGKGESHPDCGIVAPTAFCDGETRPNGDETHVHFGEHRCGRRACPECWSSQWAGPRTVSVVQRLGAARYAASEALDKRAVHAVFSPPEGSVEGTTDLFETRKQVSDLAKDHGVRGGIIVPHAYRATDRAKKRFRAQDEYGALWQFIRENGRDWRDQVYWSPHYHVVGLCRDFAASDPEADDGWIAKNVKRDGSHSLKSFRLTEPDGYDDIAGVVRYLLSHTTFPEDGDRQVVTWYGECHGTAFDPESELSGGAWSTIQRMAEEVVGSELDDEGDGSGEEEREECPHDGCPGENHDIWEADDFLADHRDDLSAVSVNKLRIALWWSKGDLDPPPGMKRPHSHEEAREAFDALCAGDYGTDRSPGTTSDECSRCGKERVCSAYEFERIFNVGAVARGNEQRARQAMMRIYPNRDENPADLLRQFLDDENAPDRICSWCLHPQ